MKLTSLAIVSVTAIVCVAVGVVLEAYRVIPSPLGIVVAIAVLGVGLSVYRRFGLI